MTIKEVLVATGYGLLSGLALLSLNPILQKYVAPIGNTWYWLDFIYGILAAISIFFTNRNGPIDNWESWSALLTNKFFNKIIILFSTIPTILKLINILPEKSKLDDFLAISYLYWYGSFLFLIALLTFNMFSPKIFKLGTFDQTIRKHGNLECFYTDAKNAIKDVEKYRDSFFRSVINIDSHLIRLKQLSGGLSTTEPSYYYSTRLGAKYLYPKRRALVSALLFFSCSVFATTTFFNIIFVLKTTPNYINVILEYLSKNITNT